MNSKRKKLLATNIYTLATVDNLGDPECKTCEGHGCVDRGNMFGCIYDYCPNCYKTKKK